MVRPLLSTKVSNGKSCDTLRNVLAANYQLMIKKNPVTGPERFPHVAYGQDKNSATYRKSFPLSYKRYFFKLVKNIIRNGKKISINKRPVSMLMTTGARPNGLSDPMVVKSKNTRLQAFKVG